MVSSFLLCSLVFVVCVVVVVLLLWCVSAVCVSYFSLLVSGALKCARLGSRAVM